MHPDPPEPTAEVPTVPEFTSEDLHERLDGVLGKGVTGTVYSLRGYPNLAVKEIQLSGLSKISVDAIKLELATVPGLAHPGIVKYHQVIWDDDLVHIVMDRHDKTLEDLVKEHKRRKLPVSIELVLSAVRQIAAALAYLHSVSGVDAAGAPFRGLVHRDLKPANVLVSEGGEHFIIADFGLCKDALRSGSTFAGTRPYMAPETLVRKKTSPASDMWSLGVVLYELATLKRPDFLEGREPAEVFVDGWKPDLSGVTDGFIRHVLEKIFVLDPTERPTARELSEMLAIFDILISELGHRYMALEGRCSSLETALNDANARIALLEEEIKAKADRIAILETVLGERSTKIASLEEALETRTAMLDVPEQELITKSARLSALEDQCKEHLAMIKALEDKFAQFGGELSEAEFSFLRLIHATRTNDTETVRLLLEERVHAGQRDEQGMTALMHAAQQGHVDPIGLLVEKEKGIKDKNGWTALMHAAYNNRPEVVEILAPHEHGKRNNNNQTALMMAAERGHAEVASLLAPHEKGLKDSRGSTALMIVAQKGSFEAVRALVEHEKGLKDDNGCIALVHAARAGHCDVAKLLIDHEKNVIGWTMLMLAAALGDTDLVSQHLDDKGKKDNKSQTALIIAAQNGRDEAVKLLMKHEGGASGWTNLIYSAYLGDIDAIKENLHEKRRQDDAGITALMWAAHQGHKGAVEILLEHEKGLKDATGMTALMHALKNKHTDVAALLREHEDPSWTPLMHAAAGDIEAVKKHISDKDEKNSDGETALIIAARAGHKDIVEFLDPTDGDKVTALMRAADRGDVEAVRALLPLQGGMKMTGRVWIDGWYINKGTALMVAALNGHTEVARLLLKREGGMSDSDGETALMLAASNGHTDCVELLLEKEGGMSDSDEWTALMYAASNGHTDCVELLLEKEGGMEDSDEWTALNSHTTGGIVIKGVKLTGQFTRTLKEIIRNVDGFCSPCLARKARETDGGVEIPCGYGKLFAAVKQRYPEADLLPLDQNEARKDRNVFTFARFKKYNADYLKTSKNVIITVTSDEFMDPEKVIAFLTKTLSKITPAQDHKFKIIAKYQVLEAIRERINADALKDASGSSVQGRCATMAIRYIEGRPPQRGTKVAVAVQASEIEKLFIALSAGDLFERVPAIRFINPEKSLRKRIQELREKIGSTGAVKKPGTKKTAAIRAQLADGQQIAMPKRKQGKRVQSQKEKLPCLLTITGIPEALAFNDIKENLDKNEHANILKALAESRLRKAGQHNSSEVSLYCTVENGEILKDAFGNMEINGAELRATLSDVN